MTEDAERDDTSLGGNSSRAVTCQSGEGSAQPHTLQALLERVQAASAPNYELEKALWYKLIFDPALERNDGSYLKLVGSSWPAYTASLDAALALVERVLPEANCVGFDKWPRGCDGYVSRNHVSSGHWLFEGSAKTPALAILAALLTALLAQQPSDPQVPGDRSREGQS